MVILPLSWIRLPQQVDHYPGLTSAWLYNNTNRSVFIVGLFHSVFNTTNGPFTREFIPATAEDRFLSLMGVIIITAILIAVATRGRLSYRPRLIKGNSPEPSPADENVNDFDGFSH